MEKPAETESVCNQTDAWDWVHTMQPAYMSIICVLGVIGNSFVLCVFCLQKRQRCVADIYLSNLAVADLLMVSCLPFWVTTIINKFNWTFGKPMCQLVSIVIGMNYYCSVLFLTLVSVDRYLALTRPLIQRRALWAHGICFIIWIAGILLSFPAILFRTVKYFPEYSVHACYIAYPHKAWRLRHNMTVSVVGFLIPVLIVSFCSFHIIKALWGSQKLRKISRSNVESNAARLVLVVLAVFILCWLPYQIMLFWDTLEYYKPISDCTQGNLLDIGTQLSTYLGYSNSSLNPFLYVIVGKHFKERAKEVFKHMFCRGKWQQGKSGHCRPSSTNKTENTWI